jgi:hypothetical protein
MFTGSVTSSPPGPNSLQMASAVQDVIAPVRCAVSPDLWMERYQQADPEAAAALVSALSPAGAVSQESARDPGADYSYAILKRSQSNGWRYFVALAERFAFRFAGKR